jgi:hypothetical protein
LKILFKCMVLQIIFPYVDTSLVNGSTAAEMATRPSSHESRVRPSVDSLLDELNTAVPNG